jgi:sodium transport system ATP-binding protein
MEEKMLVARNLVKTFEKNEKKGKKVSFNAVDGISLTVKPGEIVGILGPNGAGKTTLLRMLGLLMQPTSGAVSIERQTDGKSETITDEMTMKSEIGYLSNNTKLYGRLSTRELLELVGNIHGMSKEDIAARIENLAGVLDMGEFIDNRIEKLSTGQTQRASIARCLIHDPKLYIFDEPTLGLDIMSSSAIVEFMKQERDKGKSVIYSTHYMEEAEYLCDRIVMIFDGKIIAEGTLAELKEQTGRENLRDIFKKLLEKCDDRADGQVIG